MYSMLLFVLVSSAFAANFPEYRDEYDLRWATDMDITSELNSAHYTNEETFSKPNNITSIDPISINILIDEETKKNCPAFDISTCGCKQCILGYEVDRWGCQFSCRCSRNGLFEGDISITEDKIDELESMYVYAATSNGAMSCQSCRWDEYYSTEKNAYLVPYEIDTRIGNQGKRVIAEAMGSIRRKSCLRFKRRDAMGPNKPSDFLNITSGQKCTSFVGRRGGGQQVELGRRCMYKHIVIHELMHALGFYHEQSRPDRDDHVKIHFSNINCEHWRQFRKRGDEINSGKSHYDTNSIMHYGGYVYAVDPSRPTITLRSNGLPVNPQNKTLSYEDCLQLNWMYNCKHNCKVSDEV